MDKIQQFETIDSSNLKEESDFRHEYLPKTLRTAYQDVKKYEWTEYLIMFGIFSFGFLMALIITNYCRIKREKIDEIN